MQIVKELLVNKASFPQFCQKTACSERDLDTTLPIPTHTHRQNLIILHLYQVFHTF